MGGAGYIMPSGPMTKVGIIGGGAVGGGGGAAAPGVNSVAPTLNLNSFAVAESFVAASSPRPRRRGRGRGRGRRYRRRSLLRAVVLAEARRRRLRGSGLAHDAAKPILLVPRIPDVLAALLGEMDVVRPRALDLPRDLLGVGPLLRRQGRRVERRRVVVLVKF